MDESHDEWDITEEDERYFARLSASVAEMKVSYLAKHPQPLKDANLLLADFQKDVKEETIHTYHETIAGYQALSEGLHLQLDQLDNDEALRVKREYERWIAFVLRSIRQVIFLTRSLKAVNLFRRLFSFLTKRCPTFIKWEETFYKKRPLLRPALCFFFFPI